jgi:C4-dicarboxylate-specific signal transduction histidine kinase
LLQELVHPDEALGVERTLKRCFETGEGAVMRFRWREKDEAYRWTEWRVESRRDESGAIVQWYGASIDIEDEMRAQAELRRMHERLAQASQAASLAELSASIAHEVNQPLAAIVANSHACLRWLTADPPNLQRAQTTVERVIRDANGAADVVVRTRALFKQNLKTRSKSSLTVVIDDAKRWVSDLAIRHGVVLDSRIEPGLPHIAIDQVQIQQVLINLMRNAVEAMAMSPGNKTLSVCASRDGDVVRIEVRDTGPGVVNTEEIFDAFFTTKESGMGMGLAVSRSIVESHAGRLWAEQNGDGGASFIFILPIEAPVAS